MENCDENLLQLCSFYIYLYKRHKLDFNKMVFIMRLNEFLSLWKQAYIEIKLCILLFCSVVGKFVLIKVDEYFGIVRDCKSVDGDCSN